jgi:IS5 family transposase
VRKGGERRSGCASRLKVKHAHRKDTVHLGVDEASGEIVAAVVTTNNYSDSQLLPDLLEQVEEEISQVSGDGGL